MLYSFSYNQEEAHRPKWSPKYQKIYTDLSKVLILAYQQPHHRINVNKNGIRMIGKNEFSLCNLYGHALTLDPLHRG